MTHLQSPHAVIWKSVVPLGFVLCDFHPRFTFQTSWHTVIVKKTASRTQNHPEIMECISLAAGSMLR